MHNSILALALTLGLTGVALAQSPTPPADSAPAPLKLYFDSGSAQVRAQDIAMLDRAARAFRDGNPIVMIVSGSADAVGDAASNLRISQQRAEAVLRGLVARGIPVERFQILAKGESEPAVAAPAGHAESANRRVEISWR